MQRLLAEQLFPSGKGDWYPSQIIDKTSGRAPFDQFIFEQKTIPGTPLYAQVTDLDFGLERIESTLASGDTCELEVMRCTPTFPASASLAGNGKHIVYFTGMGTCYQKCLPDITTAAKETGATLYAFNYPGCYASTGKIREVKDLVNAGLSVVNTLLRRGVHPDTIILLGDSFGAAISYIVKREFKLQSQLDLRVIMNNTFSSFKAAVNDQLSRSLPKFISPDVKKLLVYLGYHITPGKDYKFAGPYQCHIQHAGDQLLSAKSSLSAKVSRYTLESATGETRSKKRVPYQDDCPAEYRASRDRLDQKHIVYLRADAKAGLAKKFGTDKHGNVNTHFADLCDLEIDGGGSVYTHFICDYISASDAYIHRGHQQLFDPSTAELPQPLLFSKEDISLPRSAGQALQQARKQLLTQEIAGAAPEEDGSEENKLLLKKMK